MKLINSKSQIRALHGCLVPYEVYGLQYFSLKASLKCNFKDSTSISRKIYFALLFIASLVFGGGVIVLSSIYSGKVSTKNVLTRIYSESINYTAFAALWIDLLQSFDSTKYLKKLFKNSKAIVESCYHELNVTMSFSRLRKSSWQRFLVMGTVFLIMQSTFMFRNKDLDDDYIVDLVIVVTFVTFFLMLTNKFLFYVCLINFQLEFVHKMLQSVTKNYFGPVNVKEFNLYQKSHKDCELLAKLHAIWRIYDKARENGTLVNKSLGISMFLTLMNIIMGIAYCGFVFSAAAMGDFSEDLFGKETASMLLKSFHT